MGFWTRTAKSRRSPAGDPDAAIAQARKTMSEVRANEVEVQEVVQVLKDQLVSNHFIGRLNMHANRNRGVAQ